MSRSTISATTSATSKVSGFDRHGRRYHRHHPINYLIPIGQPFQVWALSVGPDSSAKITVEDGNYNLLSTHVLAYTDFPAAGITLWFSNNVIYLPNEH